MSQQWEIISSSLTCLNSQPIDSHQGARTHSHSVHPNQQSIIVCMKKHQRILHGQTTQQPEKNESEEPQTHPSTKHTQGQTVNLQKQQHSTCFPCGLQWAISIGHEMRDQAGVLERVQPTTRDGEGRGRNMWLLQKPWGLMTTVPIDRDVVERTMIHWPAAELSSFNTLVKAPPE